MNTDNALQNQLLSYVGQLGAHDQIRVVDFARNLAESTIRGTSGEASLKFAGCIPGEDLEEMRLAIEEGCERVDGDEW
jgi:hypothetical protein